VPAMRQQMVEIVKALPMNASVRVMEIVVRAQEDRGPPRCGVPTKQPVLEGRHPS
jgi:hypothetical protein